MCFLSQQPNVNCRIESFGLTLSGLGEMKRRWVSEMGFDGLFSMVWKCLPRNLCYWLATRVDVVNKSFMTVDGKEFLLSNVQVHWVLGIPIGECDVPVRDDDDMELNREVQRIWETYATMSPSGTRGITRKKVVEVLEGDDVGEKEFKECFLMMALMDVLCPTTCHRLSVKLLPAVTVALNSVEYDWCSLVLDHLLHSIENFAKRFYVDGFAKGCGGCSIFLAVMYLDKLNRPPIRWGVFPRMKAWSMIEIKKARCADELPTGDYGKLGVIDVAYGEKHPYEPRDSMPVRSFTPASDGGGWKRYENRADVLKKGRRKRRTNVLNPWEYKMKQRQEMDNCHGYNDGDNGNEVDECCFTPSIISGGMNSAGNQLFEHGGGVDEPRENDGCFSTGCNLMMENSVGKMNSTGLGNVSLSPSMFSLSANGEYIDVEEEIMSAERYGSYAGMGERNDFSQTERNNKAQLNKDEEVVAVERSRMQRKTRSLVPMMRPKNSMTQVICQFIMHWGGLSPENHLNFDPVIFACDGESLCFRKVATVISPMAVLDTQYVRVAARMYGKVWNKRYMGRSRRIMLDPEFAFAVLEADSVHVGMIPENVIQHCLNQLDGCAVTKINMVVVPVLEFGRWWCVIFSFNRSEVIVVDSLEEKFAAEGHYLSVLKLIHGMELLVQLYDPSWGSGSMSEWPVVSMALDQTSDWRESGTLMLLVVKQSADRVTHTYYGGGGTFAEDRAWLLCEDILCEFNDAKKFVEDMLHNWKSSMRSK